MRIFLVMCLIASSTYADEVTPAVDTGIRLPDLPQDMNPDPKPMEPVPVTDLMSGELYVIESLEQPCLVLDSRKGFVTIKKMTGPVTFYAKFSDGAVRELEEERTYAGKYIYVVRALAKGSVELMVVPEGTAEEDSVMRRTLNVMGIAPIPPPDPKPPDPDVDPTPIPGNSNRVLMLYESSDLSRIPAAQAALLTSGNVRDYLERKCSKGPDGKTAEYRIWDKDVDTTNASKPWQDAMALPRDRMPWLMVSNGVTGFSGPMPADEASLLAKLKQYLGE
jgi:hypothetical protein